MWLVCREGTDHTNRQPTISNTSPPRLRGRGQQWSILYTHINADKHTVFASSISAFRLLGIYANRKKKNQFKSNWTISPETVNIPRMQLECSNPFATRPTLIDSSSVRPFLLPNVKIPCPNQLQWYGIYSPINPPPVYDIKVLNGGVPPSSLELESCLRREHQREHQSTPFVDSYPPSVLGNWMDWGSSFRYNVYYKFPCLPKLHIFGVPCFLEPTNYPIHESTNFSPLDTYFRHFP